MKCPVPNEIQSALLMENDINPLSVFVLHDGGDYLMVQNYKTGDEIVIRRNMNKKRGVAS